MLSWLVGMVLAAWFLLTVVRNIPALHRPIVRRDAGRLVPDWALFARPRAADLVLLRRDVLRDGTLTAWREVDVAGPRRWYNFLWNPELGPRRAALILASAVAAIPRRARRDPARPLGQGTPTALGAMKTVPYLCLLRYLTGRSHPAVDATQFMIIAVAGQAITGRYATAEPGTIQFVSELHRVRAGS
jgi:hypothetical protein